jgi:hypothetical protein
MIAKTILHMIEEETTKGTRGASACAPCAFCGFFLFAFSA